MVLKVYKARPFALAILFGPSVVLFAFLAQWIISTALKSPDAVGTAIVSAAIPLLALPFLLWWTLTTAFEITTRSDDSIEFRSALRRIAVFPSEIASISGGSQDAPIKLRHRGGTMRIVGRITGFED